MFKGIAAATLLVAGVPAMAQDSGSSATQPSAERDYCPARPGLGTPACTIAPGRVSVETGLVDWTRDDSPDAREDNILLGDTLVRIGVSDTLELQLGWTPFGHDRLRDKASGAVASANRVGDALVGAKLNLASPDGSGFSLAVQPYATLPVGRAPIGAGDWGAGLVVPVSFDLNDKLSLQFTPEADAATDGDGSGRHFAYSGTVGLGFSISDAVSATLEVQAARDEDPEGRSTTVLGAVSVGWTPTDDLQLDAGANVGLNRDAPDAELYVGVSHLF